MFGMAVCLRRTMAVVGAPGLGQGEVWFFYPYSDEKSLALAAKDEDPVNRYLAIQADKGPAPSSFTIPVPRDLRPPFRVQLTAGSFDPALADGLEDGVFGIGVEVEGVDPREFHELRATFVEGGLEVRAATHEGEPGAVVSLPGAGIADLAVEHDGTDLVLSARPRSEGPFQEVARIAFPATERTMRPYIHVSGIRNGAVVGFDDPVVENGSSDPGGEAEVRELLWLALEHEVLATADLDAGDTGPGPGASLGEAAAKLSEAYAKTEALLAGAAKKKGKTGPKPALRQIRKARKKIAKAIKKLDRGRPEKKVTRQVEKAMTAELKALTALDG
jgi:hypothetical protein